MTREGSSPGNVTTLETNQLSNFHVKVCRKASSVRPEPLELTLRKLKKLPEKSQAKARDALSIVQSLRHKSFGRFTHQLVAIANRLIKIICADLRGRNRAGNPKYEDVRFEGNSGNVMLTSSSSVRDPTATSLGLTPLPPEGSCGLITAAPPATGDRSELLGCCDVEPKILV